MVMRFTDDERREITAAIHSAEQRTSGEFVTVVARSSDPYLSIALLWAAGLSLLLPGVLLLLPTPIRYLHIYQLQLVLFIGLVLLFMLVPWLHMALVPKAARHARASRLAHAQFYEQGVHLTREHSGVLLFVSLAERYVEIVADRGIHERIGEERWRAIVAAFVEQVASGAVADGFVGAISACGEAMAKHYPAALNNPDELSDGLIEI
jgi:putative membrane protein